MKQDTITEKLRTLEPVIGKKKANQLRQLYLIEDDFREKRELENHIDYLIGTHVQPDLQEDVVLPPPKSQLCSGEIEIGQVSYLDKNICPFALKLKDINRHVGIFGSTGSGKTTLALHLIRNLHARQIPFMVIDWEKSYRSLAKTYKDVEVITVGQDINPLHFNPLKVPPGITSEEYSKSLVSLFAEDYLSGAGSDTVLMEGLKEAYDLHAEPTFEEFRQVMLKRVKKAQRGRSMLWAETVGRIISFMSQGAIGSVLNGKESHPLESLFTKNVVLEFGGVQSPRDRKFLIHAVLNWLSLWLSYHGIQEDQLGQTIIFEEFHNITLKGKEDDLISNLFREGRKYGLGLIAIDQTPSEIPNAIFANMNVKVSFALETNQDIKAMSAGMNMSPFDSRYLSMLSPGQSVLKVTQRFKEPFTVVVPPPQGDSDSYLTDSELKSLIQPFSEGRELDKLLLGESSESQRSRPNDTPPPSSSPIALDPIEKLFISDLVEHPFDGTDKRTKRLGLHPEVITSIHQAHTNKGLINPVMVDGKKLFELTDHGQTVAADAGIKIKPSKGRGGLEHTYWQHQTAQFLKKQGFQPSLELQDIDLVDPDFTLAIEVETGKSDLKKNLDKLTASGFLHVFMIATNREAELKIKKFQQDYPFVKMMSCKAFHKLSKKEILQRNTSPKSH